MAKHYRVFLCPKIREECPEDCWKITFHAAWIWIWPIIIQSRYEVYCSSLLCILLLDRIWFDICFFLNFLHLSRQKILCTLKVTQTRKQNNTIDAQHPNYSAITEQGKRMVHTLLISSKGNIARRISSASVIYLSTANQTARCHFSHSLTSARLGDLVSYLTRNWNILEQHFKSKNGYIHARLLFC